MSGIPYSAQSSSNTTTMMTLVDPYIFQTLQSVVQREVVIQTTQGNLRGIVVHVLPDHVVLQSGQASFFVRIQQIVWVMPG